MATGRHSEDDEPSPTTAKCPTHRRDRGVQGLLKLVQPGLQLLDILLNSQIIAYFSEHRGLNGLNRASACRLMLRFASTSAVSRHASAGLHSAGRDLHLHLQESHGRFDRRLHLPGGGLRLLDVSTAQPSTAAIAPEKPIASRP